MCCFGIMIQYLPGIIREPDDSIFNYRTDENFMDFFDPDFSAEFQPNFETPELEAEARAACGDDEFCLFDIAATGRMEVGMSTLIGGQILDEIIELSIPG